MGKKNISFGISSVSGVAPFNFGLPGPVTLFTKRIRFNMKRIRNTAFLEYLLTSLAGKSRKAHFYN